MFKSCSEIIHNTNGQGQRQIFRAPVCVGRGLTDPERASAWITEQPHTFGLESGDGLLQEYLGNIGMNQQSLHCIAGSRVLHFAVQGNGHSLIWVRLGIHIQMTHPIGMAEHGNTGVVLNEAHQFVAAPGNDQIHQSLKPQQSKAVFTGGEQSEGLGGYRCGDEALLQRCHHRLVGALSFTSTLEDRPVT